MLKGNEIQQRVPQTAGVALSGMFAAIVGLALAGCGQNPSSSSGPSAKSGASDHPGSDQDHSKKGDHASTGHSHVAPHGGQVQSVGNNHFELTFDGAGEFTLYVLGEEESKADPIAEHEIPLQVRDEGTGEFKSVKLAANPQAGESGGMSSRFIGSSDELAKLANFTAVARVPVEGE